MAGLDPAIHQKFGNGSVNAVDGNEPTIRFDKAGEKRVVDSFVDALIEVCTLSVCTLSITQRHADS